MAAPDVNRGPDAAADAGHIVYRGPRKACFECGLVLEAKDLPYEFIEQDGGCALLVPQAAAAAAREELARYAAERSAPRSPPLVLEPVEGAGMGAAAYAAILLAVAYCAGRQSFGFDWLASGALDTRPGGAGQWWRAVTALTLHLDQAHLIGNLLFGIGIGTLAARVFGPGVGWASILAAGAVANYLEMLIAPPPHSAVGASTAVFAALGLLTGFLWRSRLSLREKFSYRWAPLIAGVCLLSFLGAGAEHVDVLGHALGFICGTVIGSLHALAGLPKARGRLPQIAAGALALLLIALAWALALGHPSAA